jgi:hypothetical protein
LLIDEFGEYMHVIDDFDEYMRVVPSQKSRKMNKLAMKTRVASMMKVGLFWKGGGYS